MGLNKCLKSINYDLLDHQKLKSGTIDIFCDSKGNSLREYQQSFGAENIIWFVKKGASISNGITFLERKIKQSIFTVTLYFSGTAHVTSQN